MKTFGVKQTLSDSIAVAKSCAKEALFASAPFYVFALVGDFLAKAAGIFGLGILSIWSLNIALTMTSLVGSAKAIGVDVPLRPLQLLSERQFWLYFLATFLVWLVPTIMAFVPVWMALEVWFIYFDYFGNGIDSVLAGLLYVICLASIPVIFMYVNARISLLTPAIAAGEEFSVEKAWGRTKGKVMKIATASSILLVAVYFLVDFIWFAQILDESQNTSAVLHVVLVALLFLQSLLQGSVMGRIYVALR